MVFSQGRATDPSDTVQWEVEGEPPVFHRGTRGEYQVGIHLGQGQIKRVELRQGQVLWGQFTSTEPLPKLLANAERWLSGGVFWPPKE